MWQDLFESGRLLLPESPSPALPPVESVLPLSARILILLSVLLFVLQLRRFFELAPFLWNGIFRARGGARLENNYRISHYRNVLAITFFLPAVLLVYHYRLYNPALLAGMEPDLRLLCVAGVLLGYILLRFLLYLWMRPRRRGRDPYQLSGRLSFTFFIDLILLLSATVGVCLIAGVNELTVRNIIYAECVFAYVVYLIRRAQILSLFCNPFRTFLYLCGLEFFPTALLVVSAVVL